MEQLLLSPKDVLAIYMEGAWGEDIGKMGYGLLRYSRNPIACIVDSKFAGRCVASTMPLVERKGCVTPIVGSVQEAHALGAQVFVLGIAPSGGLLPDAWLQDIDKAVDLGMSLVNGLHDLLGPRYPHLPEGQWVWDIRTEPQGLGTGTAKAASLPCKRILTVGTDMAVGKMTAGLELQKAALQKGIRAHFVATGQIGMTITGSGIPLDAIRVDYACGAVEREVLQAGQNADWVIIEGQGSLGHPGSTSNLPLLRGACPTHLVMCHRAYMTHLRKLPEIKVAGLKPLLTLYQDLAEATGLFPRPKVAGICLNTSALSETEAKQEISRLSIEMGVVVVDPVRFGVEDLVEAIS